MQSSENCNLVILFEKYIISVLTIMDPNQMYMKRMQAGLHWLRSYCKLSEERCNVVLAGAQSKLTLTNGTAYNQELFIYWVKVLGLSEAGVKRPELVIRHPDTKKPGKRNWQLTWY